MSDSEPRIARRERTEGARSGSPYFKLKIKIEKLRFVGLSATNKYTRNDYIICKISLKAKKIKKIPSFWLAF
jgi:hypothetical protein